MEYSTNEDRLLTAKEVAKLLNCSRSTVYQLRQTGRLAPRFQIFPGQRGWRWSLLDVHGYIERCSVATLTIEAPQAYKPVELDGTWSSSLSQLICGPMSVCRAFVSVQ